MRTPRPDLAQDSEAQSFVIRVRLDAVRRKSGAAVVHLRIEHVNKRTVWQFTEVPAALEQLKACLDDIVLGSAA